MPLHFLLCFIFFNLEQSAAKIGCQHKSTLGRDYRGQANTTSQGLRCQRWSDQNPHEHPFTHVGDHNFCRNPPGRRNPESSVWCFTTDPEQRMQLCSVPLCPAVKKALDFSLDDDEKRDKNMSYTYASLERGNFSVSFTICTAFMVEEWTKKAHTTLYWLRDGNQQGQGLMVKMFAKKTNTGFDVSVSGVRFQKSWSYPKSIEALVIGGTKNRKAQR